MNAVMRMEIRRPDKAPLTREVAPGIYRIGADDDNSIVLPGHNIGSRHAVLSIGSNGCWIEDLGGDVGTYVGEHRVSGRCSLKIGQEVKIGPYVLVIQAEPVPTPALPDKSPPAQPPAGPAVKKPKPADHLDAPPTNETANTKVEQKRHIKRQIHDELVKRLNLKRLTVAGIGEEDLHERAQSTIEDIIRDVGERLPSGIIPSVLAKEVYDEAVGLGPLEVLLEDPDITEIMVNGHSKVYVEKKGRVTLTKLTFLDDASVLAVIERIVSPIGRRIDESQPYVDARLKDGSRVNAIIHPLSLVGPCLTIRKFSKAPYTDKDLIGFGSMTPTMAEFLNACVKARKNIVISGGTGSGKTTLLNVCSSYLPSVDRIITIEDAAELRLGQTHVVSLEARPPNIEGRGAVTIRDLVRNSLRMRPDRIVVGECRGGEALDMLQAMNTGHDGSLTTVHANSPRDVISRLETMVLMSGMDLPVRAIREQIASALDLIVHISRLSDGTRRIVNISEIVGLETDRITMQEIFTFVQTGLGEGGTVLGRLEPTGSVPTFLEEFKSRGIILNPEMFQPNKGK